MRLCESFFLPPLNRCSIGGGNSFLDHIHRISEPDYLPVMGMSSSHLHISLRLTFGIDDILHVRLQTLGVTEHSFDITIGGSQLNWLMYDVGGAVRLFFFLLRSWTYALYLSREDR